MGTLPTACGRPDIPQAGAGFRPVDRRRYLRDRRVLALALDTRFAAQPRELPQLRRQLGHDRHLGDALRNLRSAAGHRVCVSFRAGPGHAGGARRRHLHHPVLLAAHRRVVVVRGRSAGRGALDRLRGVGSLRAGAAAATRRQLAQSLPGLVFPVRRRHCLGLRRGHPVHRRDRLGGGDPADHHRGHQRSVRSDAARPDRGGAGARCHPLGGGPDHRAALRQVGLRQRRDAGAGARAGRDGRAADHRARHPDRVRLVAVRRWLHLRDQDRCRRIGIRRQVRGRGLHGRGPDALCAHLPGRRRRAWRRHRSREQTGQPMNSMLDRPVKSRTLAALNWRRRTANNVATVLVSLSMVIAVTPLVLVLWSVVAKGFRAIMSTVWWSHSQAGMTAFVAGGGAYHAIVGTVLQALVCAAISIPVGLMVAIYLVEYGGGTALGRLASFMVDILSGVPSILAALFIYALWVSTLGMPRSQFAVSLALVLLMIPVIVRATEEMLRIVPVDLREASYALGLPKWKTITSIVIPTGLSGIVTGIMLAVARVMGERAPLLILVGYAQSMNFDIFSGFMGTLPGMMYNQTSAGAGINPVPTDRLWGAALTLILVIATINIGARVTAKFLGAKKS